MLAYALRRVLISIPILILSTFVVFVMTTATFSPLDKLKTKNPPPPPEVIELERQRLNLDDPVLQRYWDWITGIFTGEFGPSTTSTMEIGPALGDAFLISFRLIFGAMLIALILAVVVGVISAVRQYTKIDYSFTFVGFLFLAMPTFWFAILLKQMGINFNNAVDETVIFTFSDSSTYVEGGTWAEIADVLGHMVLPTISLALLSFAAWSRFCRGSMLEVLNSDYVRLARAKGLPNGKVMRKHALRTALIPLTTVTALDLGAILSGAVVTESVFEWNGAGRFLLEAINRQDAYAVQGWLLISATFIILANLVADLLYGVLDPRIRYA